MTLGSAECAGTTATTVEEVPIDTWECSARCEQPHIDIWELHLNQPGCQHV